MKRILITLMKLLLLSACASKEPVTSEAIEPVSGEQETTKSLKDTAIEADFAAMNGNKVELGTAVYVKGEVALVLTPGKSGSFSFDTEGGMYTRNHNPRGTCIKSLFHHGNIIP